MLNLNEINHTTLYISEKDDYKMSNLFDFAIEGNEILIYNYAEYNYCYGTVYLKVGHYNMDDKQGKIFVEGMKEYKWYKNLGSIVNAVLKSNNNMGMFTTKETILKAYEDNKKNNEVTEIEPVTVETEVNEEIKQTEDIKEKFKNTTLDGLKWELSNYEGNLKQEIKELKNRLLEIKTLLKAYETNKDSIYLIRAKNVEINSLKRNIKEYELYINALNELIRDYKEPSYIKNNTFIKCNLCTDMSVINEECEEYKKEIESATIIQENKIEMKETNNNKFYIGQMEFEDYASAEQYCIENDYLPELMITQNNNSTIDDNKSIVDSKEMKTPNNFTLNCSEIIERIVDNDTYLLDETMKEIYEEYTKENMINCIRYINKEFNRLELYLQDDYVNAFKRLKEILKNIEELKEVYQYSTTMQEKTFLTICNKFHYSKNYYTISTIENKKYLVTNLHYTSNEWDNWNSKNNDILITMDTWNNIYKFIFKNGKYELIQGYTLENKNLIEGIEYKNIYGICKVKIESIV